MPKEAPAELASCSRCDLSLDPRALALFDEFVVRGLLDANHRSLFEHATNGLVVQDIARELGAAAHKL